MSMTVNANESDYHILNTPSTANTMKPITLFSPGYLPKNDVQLFVNTINEKINQYNLTETIDKKKIILNDLNNIIKQFDNTFPASFFSRSPGYQKTHEQLGQMIQEQYKALNGSTNESTLATIIATMPPAQLNKLLSILDKDNAPDLAQQLRQLYPLTDDSQEASNFRDFLNTHTLRHIEGGNSRLFCVTQTSSGLQSLLKVDNRLDMPRTIETHLRQTPRINACFTSLHAQQQAHYQTPAGKDITRTILVTDYCSNGDLMENRAADNTRLATDAGLFFEQMATILLAIEQAGCIFPDAKITNWLVDDQKKLCISDTKSFLFTDKDGYYSAKLPGNKYTSFIPTAIFSPPEFFGFHKKKADSAHAYLLGKNLYLYATASMGKDDKFDFTKPFFQTEKGSKLKMLIQDLTKPNASERLSMNDALTRLFTLNNPEFEQVFSKLQGLRFGANDVAMNQFISDRQQEINAISAQAPDAQEQKARILAQLNRVVDDLTANSVVMEIKSVADNYRKKAGLMTIGMHAKANRIERAMATVPVEQRREASVNNLPDVMKALASHRHVGKQGKVYLTEHNEIDANKAAHAFKSFKHKFHMQQINLSVQTDEKVEEVSPSLNGKR